MRRGEGWEVKLCLKLEVGKFCCALESAGTLLWNTDVWLPPSDIFIGYGMQLKSPQLLPTHSNVWEPVAWLIK